MYLRPTVTQQYQSQLDGGKNLKTGALGFMGDGWEEGQLLNKTKDTDD